MEIKSTQFKHCNLVEISGRIDSYTAPQLDVALKKITDGGNFNIILDLKNVEFLSSAALRVFINYQKLCRRYNRGEVVLADIQENVLKALDLAGFTRIFKIFDTAVLAVGSFQFGMKCKKFAGTYKNLERIADYLCSAARETGLSSFDVYAIETAVDEACSNIIEHGFDGREGGEITCCYETIDKGIKITLIDHGGPFNPANIPFPDLTKSLDEREAHGLGLYFIRKWMDEFFYESDPDNGNRMVMVKYRESMDNP